MGKRSLPEVKGLGLGANHPLTSIPSSAKVKKKEQRAITLLSLHVFVAGLG
jgi:hypothetical protein